MNRRNMNRPTSPARLRWLAVGLLLLICAGCSRNDSSTATDEASKDSRAGVTPTPVSDGATGAAKGFVVPATPSVSASEPAADDYDVLSISADADPDSGGAPLTVNFTAEVEGGPPGLRYRWDFGDETPPVRQLRAQHVYQKPGDYTATFWVTGSPESGVDESREINIDVAEEGFDFDIETDSDVGEAPLKVEFTARLDEDLPGPFYFQWDFGDGARDVSNPTTHVYHKPGEYTANVTVTNAQGQHATREVEITVDELSDAPQADE